MTVDIAPPVRWDDPRLPRSAAYELHAWIPLTPAILRLEDTGDGRYRTFVLEAVLDWLGQHPTERPSDFAWYDMAVGHRAQRLGWLLDRCLRDDTPDEVAERLLDGALLHARLLADPGLAWHSNHGFYVTAGQLALARRFPDVPALAAGRAQGIERMTEMLRRQFTPDGVHVEHSPGYHLAVLQSVLGLAEAGLLDTVDVAPLTGAAERALAWMIRPDGHAVAFGDTQPQRVSGLGVEHEYGDEVLRWVVGSGRSGAPASQRVQAFTEGGYAIARTWEGDGTDSFLAMTAAFHSRTHKHADAGALVWFERGGELIADAGRFGYRGKTTPGSPLALEGHWYADPGRVYAESTVAHSTIEVDGRSQPRVDVEPFGSAIVEAADHGDVLVLRADVPSPGGSHRRVAVLDPRRWLVVIDLVKRDAPAEEITRRFLMAPDLVLDPSLPPYRLSREGWTDALWLAELDGAEPVKPVRGATEPRYEGWVSPSEYTLEPAWSIVSRRRGSDRATFAALLAFGVGPPTGTARWSDGEDLALDWTQDGVSYELRLSMVAGSAVSCVSGSG